MLNKLFTTIALTLITSIFSWCFAAELLDDASRNLAKCEGVFAYGVNRFMILNNEGAAKVMALQQARTTTTLFARNYQNGTIAGDKVQAFKEIRRKTKPLMDNKPELFEMEIDACTEYVSHILQTTDVTKVRLWNKEFFEVVNQMARKIREAAGISS